MALLMRRDGPEIFISYSKEKSKLRSGDFPKKLPEGIDPESELGKAITEATKALEEMDKLFPESPDQPPKSSDDDQKK
jgi:hypothetical protein